MSRPAADFLIISAGAMDVLKERNRQQQPEPHGEAISPESDDQYHSWELERVAAMYTVADAGLLSDFLIWPDSWPKLWWKPTTHRRNLVKAAALLIAAIEKIDRRQT